jgi:flavin-dependent dehydrogenase
VTGAHGANLTGLFAEARSGHNFGVGRAIPRRRLDEALLNAAGDAGAEIHQRTRLVRLLHDDHVVRGAILRGPDGQPFAVSARITVGADGLQSRVAQAFGGRRHGRLRRWALVAHMSGVAGLDDRAELHLAQDAYVGINPLPGGLANIAMVMGPSRAAHLAGGLESRFHDTLRDLFPRVQSRFGAATFEGPVRAVGPFDVRSRRPIVPGGILVGDAADFFDPFTGEGIHAALTGARLATGSILAAVRHQGLDQERPLPALTDYLRARRRAFWGKWVIERMIGYGMQAPALFDRAVGRIGRRPAMAHTMIGVTGHLVPPTRVLNPLFLARTVL